MVTIFFEAIFNEKVNATEPWPCGTNEALGQLSLNRELID